MIDEEKAILLTSKPYMFFIGMITLLNQIIDEPQI